MYKKGHPGYWKGKHRSTEDRERMKKGHRERNYIFTPAHRKKLQEARRKYRTHTHRKRADGRNTGPFEEK